MLLTIHSFQENHPASAEASTESARNDASNVATLKRELEESIQSTLKARLVCLTKDGQHAELTRLVASTDLYQQLASEAARFQGIYDVKNARISEIYEGNSIFQKQPPLDVEDFETFSEVMHNLMKDGCDVYWILCGRYEVSYTAIMEFIKKKGWNWKMWYLNYDVKAMAKYYWKRCRGLANSNSLEKIILCWKGKLPAKVPNERYYVDVGSRLYNEVVNKVPVTPPKELAWVDKDVRVESLKSLVAGPTTATAEEIVEDNMNDGELRVQVKKRRLYRQASGTQQVWFPFEMSVSLAQELVWESGGDEVKWVLHGTPAAGNVVLGSLEMNANVIAFMQDAHQEKHFRIALTEKIGERLASGQARVFGNPFLRAKVNAALGKDSQKDTQDNAATKDAVKVDQEGNEDEAVQTDKKGGAKIQKDVQKKTKKTKRKKTKETDKKKKKSSSSSSSSSSTSST